MCGLTTSNFMVWFPEAIAAVPKIVNIEVPGWSERAELG
jgi:hypothetical protein